MKDRQKLSGKRLLGFLPTITVLTKYKGNAQVTRFKRRVLRKAMAFVTAQITAMVESPERGITFIVGKARELCLDALKTIHNHLAGLFLHPRVACFIADEKDQSAAITGLFSASSLTRRPCNMCLLDFQSQSLTLTGQPRTLKQMRQVRA